MARAPRGDDSDPDLIEFGIPILDDRVEEADLEFPADRGDIEVAIGPVEIPYDAHGHTVTIADALRQVDQESFETKRELLDALHPVFEARRRGGSGVLATIRSLLPF